MRNATLIALAAVSLLAAIGPAGADGKSPVTRQQIEEDLAVVAKSLGSARIRPGEPLRLEARLVNQSPDRSHRVIDPGTGSGVGLVEPFVYYSARYRPHDGKVREIVAKLPPGMCGMGDFRWMPRVTDLAPGKSIEFGSRMSAANLTLDLKEPGRYDVRLHYEYRAKGTTEKLPQADPVGKLGPMKSIPRFTIQSEPVRIDVVRPFEILVDVKGKLEKGVTKKLSELVTVRVENWTQDAMTLSNSKLRIVVQPQAGKGAARVKRVPIAFPAIVLAEHLKPGEGMTVIGPETGWFDEAWTPLDDGHVELRVVAVGHAPGAERVPSHVITIPGREP